MIKHRCIDSFESENGSHYRYGVEICNYEFKTLSPVEQLNFEVISIYQLV